MNSPRVPSPSARRAIVPLCSLLLLLLATAAFAQVPPHRPGEICFTPKLWCWQKPPGRPGTPCSCLTPFGPMSGRLG